MSSHFLFFFDQPNTMEFVKACDAESVIGA